MKTTHRLLTNLAALAFFAMLVTSSLTAQVVTVISSDPRLGHPTSLTTDGINLYVANSTALLRVPIGGGTVTFLGTNFTPCCVAGLTVQGTHLYYIDPNGDPDATAIWRTGTNGGTPVKLYSGFATGQPIVDGSGIITDCARLYTVDYFNGRVHRMDLQRNGITQLGERYPGGFAWEHRNAIAQSETTLFIADDGSKPGIPPQIVSIPKTGGSFTTLASGAPLVSPSSLTVAGGRIFVADPGASNTIWMLPLVGSSPVKLISGTPFTNIHSVAASGDALYVTDTGGVPGGRIYKVTIPARVPDGNGAPMSNPPVLALDTYAGLTLAGEVGWCYRIEFKDSLEMTGWTTLTNVTLTTTPFLLVDPESPKHPTRFYRAVPGR